MKRSLIIVFVIVFFSFVLGQQREPRQDEYRRNPPTVDEFPRADRSCKTKHKLYVSTVAGNPVGSERGSALVSCQFHTVGCDAKITWYKSVPALGRQGICDGWVAARNAIANAEVEACCDPETATPNPPADGQKPPNCEPPAPWFDNTAPCRDRQKPSVEVKERTPSTSPKQYEAVASICGVVIFRGVTPYPDDRTVAEAHASVVLGQIERRIGGTVCCDKFNEAVRTGQPCDPRMDVDCDGRTNQRDTVTSGSAVMPDIDTFGRLASSTVIAPRPSWLDQSDPDFRPERTGRNSTGVGECPCKWELVEGKLERCNRTQKQVYKATWWCPTTKAEVITFKTEDGQPCQ